MRATSSAAVDRAEAQLRASQERLQAAETSAKTRGTEVRRSGRDTGVRELPKLRPYTPNLKFKQAHNCPVPSPLL